jgi:hypothetical protein
MGRDLKNQHETGKAKHLLGKMWDYTEVEGPWKPTVSSNWLCQRSRKNQQEEGEQ